jgi:hypothetical protein
MPFAFLASARRDRFPTPPRPLDEDATAMNPSTPRRVAVYVGRRDRLPRHSLLSFLCDRWRDAGIEIAVLDDPGRWVDADVAIMHVDATRRPPAYDAVLERYPRVINGRVRDISKRRISAQLLTRGSGYHEPVIVKTDGNYCDQPDSRRRRLDNIARHLCSRVADRLLPVRQAIHQSGTYPIYPSLRHVPRRVWWDPRLVVEPFLPERQDDLYCLRTWVFFGAREKASVSLSANPVVKRVNTIRSEFIPDVPEAIREVRRRLGFDYGKFDFVIHQGEPVLLDANSTPACSGRSSPRLDAIADELAADLLAAPEPAQAAR